MTLPPQQPGPDTPDGKTPNDRLDVVLGRRLGLSRQRVRDLLAAGHVRVDGQTATLKHKGQPIGPGHVVTVDKLAGDGQAEPQPDPRLELEELATGAGWVVVNKPAGVPVRPHRADETGTVINALAAKYPQLVGVGEGGLRSGVVHRLDTDTSGVLIVATEQEAWRRLRAAFAEHRTAKRYTALVHGRLAPGAGQRETLYLRVARRKDAWVRVADEPFEDARRCTLTWNALRCNDDATLIEIDLETGFLHQIRAMMAHLGHPVVGDTKYAHEMATYGATRQMLHASVLGIMEMRLVVECSLANDMQAVIEMLEI
ncbi:MAG: pseudouridine synthase [Phycisphaerales bacterium JB063]